MVELDRRPELVDRLVRPREVRLGRIVRDRHEDPVEPVTSRIRRTVALGWRSWMVPSEPAARMRSRRRMRQPSADESKKVTPEKSSVTTCASSNDCRSASKAGAEE